MILGRVKTKEYCVSLHNFYKYPLMFAIYYDENYSYFITEDLKNFDKEYFKNHLIGHVDCILERIDILDVVKSFYPLDKYIVKIGL